MGGGGRRRSDALIISYLQSTFCYFVAFYTFTLVVFNLIMTVFVAMLILHYMHLNFSLSGCAPDAGTVYYSLVELSCVIDCVGLVPVLVLLLQGLIV